MAITVAQLRTIAVGTPPASNLNSVVVAVNEYGPGVGIDKPWRLAHLIAQLAHESGGFRWDQELASGAAYEGRKDLGNTQPGDGRKFKGHGPIQVTGRANHRAFTAWVRERIPNAPSFEASPELINTDPYEGLSAIWYWDTRGLNAYADRNDIEMITRKINGGLNGYADRLTYYDRTALTLLGWPLSVKQFQQAAGLLVDGVSGPRTRAEMHRFLKAAA